MSETETPAAPEPTACIGVPCEDGELCSRHEVEAAHADGDHGLCGPECRADKPLTDEEIDAYDVGGGTRQVTISADDLARFVRDLRTAHETPEPLRARWDREVSHDPDGTTVQCVGEDGRGIALVLDVDHREALGASLCDPNGEDDQADDGELDLDEVMADVDSGEMLFDDAENHIRSLVAEVRRLRRPTAPAAGNEPLRFALAELRTALAMPKPDLFDLDMYPETLVLTAAKYIRSQKGLDRSLSADDDVELPAFYWTDMIVGFPSQIRIVGNPSADDSGSVDDDIELVIPASEWERFRNAVNGLTGGGTPAGAVEALAAELAESVWESARANGLLYMPWARLAPHVHETQIDDARTAVTKVLRRRALPGPDRAAELAEELWNADHPSVVYDGATGRFEPAEEDFWDCQDDRLRSQRIAVACRALAALADAHHDPAVTLPTTDRARELAREYCNRLNALVPGCPPWAKLTPWSRDFDERAMRAALAELGAKSRPVPDEHLWNYIEQREGRAVAENIAEGRDPYDGLVLADGEDIRDDELDEIEAALVDADRLDLSVETAGRLIRALRRARGNAAGAQVHRWGAVEGLRSIVRESDASPLGRRVTALAENAMTLHDGGTGAAW